MIPDKKQLRKSLLHQRNSLNADAQAHLSLAVCQRIGASEQWQQAQSVALYLAHRREVSLQSLDWVAKKVYLPSTRGAEMRFIRWRSDEALECNEFGIQQPPFDSPNVLANEPIDLCLMPLVGFDRAGHRLGMGGGFYDRLLGGQHARVRVLAGVAYDFQEVVQLPTDDWDIDLNIVFTNKETITP